MAGLIQRTHVIVIETPGRGLHPVTAPIRRWVAAQRIGEGLLTIWCRHTSASLLVQENADPDVLADLADFFAALVPDGGAERYRHWAEGADDMSAHIRAALTQTQLSLPILGGVPALGTWQGIHLFEHRTAPQRRGLALHLLGAPVVEAAENPHSE
jgi:secondary thiamine-phosphate synthase enzyme